MPDAALQRNLVDKDYKVIIAKVQEKGLQCSDADVPCDGELLASEAGQQLSPWCPFHGTAAGDRQQCRRLPIRDEGSPKRVGNKTY